MDGYEVGSYEVDSYEWSTINTLYVNCGITLVMVNNAACPTCLSSVPETTCLIEHVLRCPR